MLSSFAVAVPEEVLRDDGAEGRLRGTEGRGIGGGGRSCGGRHVSKRRNEKEEKKVLRTI